MNLLLLKILKPRIWQRIYLERLGEPLFYNLISIYVFFFGSFKTKIEYDLILRQPYAFGINEAFKIAKEENINKIHLIEFGVAAGAGLYNMSYIASKLSHIYKINYEIIGFDSGEGMPEAIDYRDHPEKYRKGDFPSLLLKKSKLPRKCKIIYGNIKDTLKLFTKNKKNKDIVIGFVSVDVDYYSSTKECLDIFMMKSKNYLSRVTTYFDDVNNIDHNIYCGEFLAIEEFNKKANSRKICRMNQLRSWRLFKNALYLDQMYFCHIFDHKRRDPKEWKNEKQVVLSNPYIGQKQMFVDKK